MCGVGILLLEAASDFPLIHYIGIDKSRNQLAMAMETVRIAKMTSKIDLIQGEATALSFPNESIDRIICDIPFGKKFSSYEENKTLYPKLLQEFSRVLKPFGLLVLLTALNQLLDWNLKRKFSNVWLITKKLPVTLGKTEATIYVLSKHPTKNAMEYSEIEENTTTPLRKKRISLSDPTDFKAFL